MKKMSSSTPSKLSLALTREKNICRAIAAWSLYALALLLFTEGDFFDLSFAQDSGLGVMILAVLNAIRCLFVKPDRHCYRPLRLRDRLLVPAPGCYGVCGPLAGNL